ncbi:hypothetical protein [Methylorubrum aminovorans]
MVVIVRAASVVLGACRRSKQGERQNGAMQGTIQRLSPYGMEFGFPLTADRALLAAVGAWSGTFPGFAVRVGGIEAAWLRIAGR